MSFCESHSLLSIAFKVTFVQYKKDSGTWMNSPSVHLGLFSHANIRHSFTIPMGQLLVLYSNGLARYPSMWLIRGHDTYQVGFALIPRLALVPFFTSIFSEPRLRGSMCGTFSQVFSRWGVFWQGQSNEPCPIDLSFGHCLTNRCSLLDRIPYSTCPSHRFSQVFSRSYGRKVKVRHLFTGIFSVGC